MRLTPYIRVSTDDQRDNGHSVGHQIERIRTWAAFAGHELADAIIDEGVSGSTPIARRPGAAKLLQRIRNGATDGVVVTRVNRLFRNLFDGVRFFEENIENQGAHFFSVTEYVTTSTPSGWLSLVMLLAAADYDRRQDVLASIETIAALKKSGKVYAGIPYGCVAVGGVEYVDDASGKKRKRGAALVRDPQLWTTRCYIVELLRGGLSQVAVRERLVKERIRAPQGGKYWQTSTLRNLLKTHDGLMHLSFGDEHSNGKASREAPQGTSPVPQVADGKSCHPFSTPVIPMPQCVTWRAFVEETGVSRGH